MVPIETSGAYQLNTEIIAYWMERVRLGEPSGGPRRACLFAGWHMVSTCVSHVFWSHLTPGQQSHCSVYSGEVKYLSAFQCPQVFLNDAATYLSSRAARVSIAKGKGQLY